MKSSDKLEFLYKFINLHFGISAISTFPFLVRYKHHSRKTLLNDLFSFFITILLIGITICFCLNASTVKLMANAAMFCISVICRCIICVKFRKLKKILKHFCRLTCENSRFMHCLYLVSLFRSVCNILNLICGTFWLMYIKSPFSFFVSLQGSILPKLIQIIHTFSINILLLPVDIFGISYAVICFQIRQKIFYLLESMIFSPNIDYEVLQNQYLSIKRMATYVDNELSLLAFVSTVHNGGLMYFAILSYKVGGYDIPDLAFVWIAFLINFMCTVVMLSAGAFVNEASKEVWEKALMLPDSRQKFLQERYLSFCKEGISMTLWKLIPIRRILILTNFGTVFTYTLLLDGLHTLPKENNLTVVQD